MNVNYADAEKCILATCWRFKAKYGGDLDEILSDANWKFISIYPRYAASGKSKPFLVACITNALLDGLRSRLRQPKQLQQSDWVPATGFQRPFDHDEFLASLTPDAATVVKLVLVNEEFSRISLRAHLTRLGWDAKRISSSFFEVRLALGE